MVDPWSRRLSRREREKQTSVQWFQESLLPVQQLENRMVGWYFPLHWPDKPRLCTATLDQHFAQDKNIA